MRGKGKELEAVQGTRNDEREVVSGPGSAVSALFSECLRQVDGKKGLEPESPIRGVPRLAGTGLRQQPCRIQSLARRSFWELGLLQEP